jgi:phenylacetate-CoA ligase
MVSMRGTLDRNTFSYLDKSSNVLYLSSYHLKEERIEEYYQKILDFKPKVIEAYPSSLHILATELHKRGIEIDIPIAFTSSEVVHDFQRELIEEIFKTKIYDWYGNAERTVALGQFDDQLYRELPLYSHLEVKDDHLITTSFINTAFPLIRYKVDDVIKTASNTNGECVVVKIEGRDDDYVLLANGQKVGRLDLAFKKVKNLLGAQIIQTAVGSIQVNFVPGKDFSKTNLNELQANLINLIGPDCRIKFDKIDAHQLIRTKSGKFKLVVSML